MTMPHAISQPARACLLAVMLCIAPLTATAEGEPAAMLTVQLKNALESKRSVVVYVNGQTLAGLVVRMDEHTVLLKNREYNEILVRLDRIDAIASN